MRFTFFGFEFIFRKEDKSKIEISLKEYKSMKREIKVVNYPPINWRACNSDDVGLRLAG